MDGKIMIGFVQNKDTQNIKIDLSKDLKKRIKALQTACDGELVLLACVPGSYKKDTRLKHWFRSCRKRGEWFFPSPELIAFISSISMSPFKEGD